MEFHCLGTDGVRGVGMDQAGLLQLEFLLRPSMLHVVVSVRVLDLEALTLILLELDGKVALPLVFWDAPWKP